MGHLLPGSAASSTPSAQVLSLRSALRASPTVGGARSARSAKEACGYVTAAIKRRLGLVLVREMARFRLLCVTALDVPNSALSGQADLQLRRRHGVDEPLDRPPAFVPEEFFAFQAFAAPRAT